MLIGEVLAEVAEAQKEDVDIAVRAAARAFDGPWRKMAPRERGALIYRLAELVAADKVRVHHSLSLSL